MTLEQFPTIRQPETDTRPAAGTRSELCHYPATSVLIGFGAGLGVGVFLGYLLGESARQDRWDGRTVAEVGRHVLDAAGRAVPESFASRLHR